MYGNTGILKTRRPIIVPSGHNMVRTLIEGGSYYDWASHYLDVNTFNLSPDVQRVVIAGYPLDLVRTFDSEGVILPVQVVEDPETLQLNSFSRKIERPTTLVVEDGRVYHDVGLLFSDDGFNNRRLDSFLKLLSGDLDFSDGFDRLYETCGPRKGLDLPNFWS